MKKYHLFAGAVYYPIAGLGDYQGSFETFEEAMEKLDDMVPYGRQWAVVAETQEDGSLLETWIDC